MADKDMLDRALDKIAAAMGKPRQQGSDIGIAIRDYPTTEDKKKKCTTCGQGGND